MHPKMQVIALYHSFYRYPNQSLSYREFTPYFCSVADEPPGGSLSAVRRCAKSWVLPRFLSHPAELSNHPNINLYLRTNTILHTHHI